MVCFIVSLKVFTSAASADSLITWEGNGSLNRMSRSSSTYDVHHPQSYFIPHRACTARGQVIALGLDNHIIII